VDLLSLASRVAFGPVAGISHPITVEDDPNATGAADPAAMVVANESETNNLIDQELAKAVQALNQDHRDSVETVDERRLDLKSVEAKLKSKR
jgi:hypothetical protein